MTRVICLLIGYAFGIFQTGYFYGMSKGIDIRTKGSGNAGTTNTLRTLGLKAGLITMAGDVGKAILAIFLTWAIFHGSKPELFPLLKIWTGAGVVLGHDYPFYMKFRGGKGIAATAGTVIAFGDLRLIVLCAALFLVTFFTTHLVSLCSILLSCGFLIGMIILGQMGVYPMGQSLLIEMYLIQAALTFLAVYRHRSNVGRLLAGKERKTYLTRKSDS
ncbi:MAG: glycerol-3-phosphate acyltransferase [Eubacterium sp.]|nr:glycerol-3-phosphate acyltransferase [Eubacterium sp.]